MSIYARSLSITRAVLNLIFVNTRPITTHIQSLVPALKDIANIFVKLLHISNIRRPTTLIKEYTSETFNLTAGQTKQNKKNTQQFDR